MAKASNALSDAKCSTARFNSDGTGNKLADGGGLYLLLTAGGGKIWRLKYRRPLDNKEDTLVIGTYPAITLKAARTERDKAKALLARGIDPKAEEAQKREAAAAEAKAKSEAEQATKNTFRAIAIEWMEHRDGKAPATQSKSAWIMQNALDAFGDKPITAVMPTDILAACRSIEAKGQHETAHRLRSTIGMVFRYAIGTGKAITDPARDLAGGEVLKPVKVTHRAAITDPAGVGKLMRDIRAYSGRAVTKAALMLSPLVFVRPGELRAAKWADIDMEAATWTYTPPKTREQTGVDLVVPLSRQALEILRDIQQITGRSEYVFAMPGNAEGHLSENGVLVPMWRLGYKGKMTAHGFRAIARTLLDEVLGFDIAHIEMQLGHQVRDMHGRAYNRTKHLEARTKMMQAWSDYLDKLANGADIINIADKRA